MKMKKLVEINIPLLAQNNTVIGTYSHRFNTRAEAKRHIFQLEADGLKMQDPFNEKNFEIVEVPDESNLQ